MSTTRLRRVLVTSLLFAATLATPGAAAADSPAADLTGPNVVRYATDAVLRDARRLLVQGQRTATGGCSFSVTDRGHADAPALHGQEIAFDPDTCRSLLEIGIPVTTQEDEELVQIDETWSPDANDYVSQPWAVDVTPGLATADGAIPLAASTRTRGLHTWFRDPPGIHVNDAKNTVSWQPSSSCAFPPGSTAKVTGVYEWLALTGWTFRGRSWSPSFNCTAVTSRSWDIKFRNRVFCAGIGGPILLLFPTDTELNNQIRGLPGGGYDYTYQWSKSGPCSVLLSFGWQVYVP